MADVAVTVIGGGVVGLAIAAELAGDHAPLYLLERHPKCGEETSSRNSEVIHAGIYYPHGSLKAALCVEGKKKLYEICTANGIPHKRVTKIITATKPDELQGLDRLMEHGLRNGVELVRMTEAEVHTLEPAVASVGGILSPSTGIISAHGLMDYFRHVALTRGATIQNYCEVAGIEKRRSDFLLATAETGEGADKQVTTFSSERVINAAGLESDTIAALAGIDIDEAGYRLHWSKGSYFAVMGEKRKIVSRLIYPLPPKESLGVHAVVDIGGGLRFGPDVEYLAKREQDYSVDEGKLEEFGRAVRQIVPSLTDNDLSPGTSGIRAKLQNKGEEPRDFIIRNEKEKGLDGFINLIGIDSPGLTASPAIAAYVRRMMKEM